MKHLHVLETFTVGHNVIDFESTALHNLKEIVESELNNSYSQNPTLFLIYNLREEMLNQIVQVKGIRCILNVNEIVHLQINDNKYVIFNKKNNSFLNYNISELDLEFENLLIQTSRNQNILLDKIQKIKTVAGSIFAEYVDTGELGFLNEILAEYPRKYWNKILKFVELYFDIELPQIETKGGKFSNSHQNRFNKLKTFVKEYEFVININKQIAREFVQVLHDYRHDKVNPANLELEQLYDPQKLYDYLRNHHWKDGIPEDFLASWVAMNYTKFELSETDNEDFKKIFTYLKVPDALISKLIRDNTSVSNSIKRIQPQKKHGIESPLSDFVSFKKWFLETLNRVEQKVFENSLQNELYFRKKQKLTLKGRVFVVDGTNVAYHSLSKNGGAQLVNIKLVYDALRDLGAKKIVIVSDASLANCIDLPDAYLKCVKQNLILQAPDGIPVEELLLKYARDQKALIISNNFLSKRFNQNIDELVKKDILPFWIMDGKAFFRI